MTDAGALELALGLLATGGFAISAWALKRAAVVDVLKSKIDDKAVTQAEHHAQLAVLATRIQDVDGRLYGLHSDLAVLRAQVNGVNGNNGLNGTVKLDQERIAHLGEELEGIKLAIQRLELTLKQHIKYEESE